MKLYYIDNGQNPNILAAVYDRDAFAWENTIQVPHVSLDIDELSPENKPICRALADYIHRRDAAGSCRFYIDSAGQVIEVEGWQEAANG